MGYEVQLTLRHGNACRKRAAISACTSTTASVTTAGPCTAFGGRQERDLFRELVAVSGVGPQMALGLLGRPRTYRTLCARSSTPTCAASAWRRGGQAHGRAPGGGAAGAPAGALRRGGPLAEGPRPRCAVADGGTTPPAPCREEVQITLVALGYEPLEIHRALRAVAAPA